MFHKFYVAVFIYIVITPAFLFAKQRDCSTKTVTENEDNKNSLLCKVNENPNDKTFKAKSRRKSSLVDAEEVEKIKRLGLKG